LLELAHQQAHEVEPGPLRLEELVQEEASFDQVVLTVEDLVRQTFDHNFATALKDLDRGAVLVGLVTKHGCSSLLDILSGCGCSSNATPSRPAGFVARCQ